MTTKQIVKQALAYCDLSNAELASSIRLVTTTVEQAPSTGKLSPEEWTAIGEAIGAEAKICFHPRWNCNSINKKTAYAGFFFFFNSYISN